VPGVTPATGGDLKPYRRRTASIPAATEIAVSQAFYCSLGDDLAWSPAR